MKHLLFVCLGNICRSPTAEGVMNKMIKDSGLVGQIDCDSAGTLGAHTGEPADPRMSVHAQKRNYHLTSRARKFEIEDFINFDYILTMDDSNFNDITKLDTDNLYDGKIKKMVSFCQKSTPTKVPDPYYGGPEDFEKVLDILEDACQGLLTEIQTEINNELKT